MAPVGATTLRDMLAGVGAYLLARRLLPFVFFGAFVVVCCLCQFWLGLIGMGLSVVSPSATARPSTPTVASHPIVPLGTVVELPPLRLSVEGGERLAREGRASTDLVAIFLRVENPTTRPAPIDRGRFELQDSRGRRYFPLVRPDLTLFPKAPPAFSPTEPIPAGERVDVVFVYETQRDAAGLLLRVGGTLFATGLR
ncbi:MAG: hypothetical protein KatS3mg060_3285 [Dehalococcoidia bacterium]|nr:MAG: hypothetical protein KatS3mg060_3285 [Dehalococcoidia bacterium]